MEDIKVSLSVLFDVLTIFFFLLVFQYMYVTIIRTIADPNFANPMNQFPSQNLQISGIGSGINAADLSALLLRGGDASSSKR